MEVWLYDLTTSSVDKSTSYSSRLFWQDLPFHSDSSWYVTETSAAIRYSTWLWTFVSRGLCSFRSTKSWCTPYRQKFHFNIHGYKTLSPTGTEQDYFVSHTTLLRVEDRRLCHIDCVIASEWCWLEKPAVPLQLFVQASLIVYGPDENKSPLFQPLYKWLTTNLFQCSVRSHSTTETIRDVSL